MSGAAREATRTDRTRAVPVEHRAPAASLVQPKGLRELLRWYLAEWSKEIPDTLHVPGVWRDFVRWDEGRRAVGGSLIGSPAMHDAFRRYVENSPSEADAEGFYMRPIHRALAAMAGRRESGPGPFMARFLLRLAWSGGDIEATGAGFGIVADVVRPYTETALFHAWSLWRPEQ